MGCDNLSLLMRWDAFSGAWAQHSDGLGEIMGGFSIGSAGFERREGTYSERFGAKERKGVGGLRALGHAGGSNSGTGPKAHCVLGSL